MVTHEEQYAAMAQRIVIMDDGKIVSVGHTA
jgi:ABC-type lipoprotein export system ATPase subunit